MSSDELFTREEVLGGLPARQASTLLFLIESRTAHMVARSPQAIDPFLTERGAQERDLAFLEAFSLGREPPLRPTIQDLERYAPHWARLVPENPNVRAAVAHIMGQKYVFTSDAVPGIRAALGLDEQAVQQAYRRLYRDPLQTIFASRPTMAERLRWAWAALSGWPDSLPPFWTACVLTIAWSLPQALLALPIGVAHVGLLAGTVFVVAIGLINVLTMACMAEACARSGAIRYGKAYLGRLVNDYLGREASVLLIVTTTIRTFLLALAAPIGFALTLAPFTHAPAAVWLMLLVGAELYLLSRKSLKLRVTSLVSLAAANIALLILVSLLALTRARLENVLYGNLPFWGREPFDPSILGLLIGVILMTYFGQLYMIICAKVVLPRDPSARSLIRGSVAGTACLIALLTLWVVAVNGAITPQVLAGQMGTALTPLAEQVSPSIRLLGSFLVILFLGMAFMRSADTLFNLIQEQLPRRPRSTVILPRRRGSLFLQQRGTLRDGRRFGLTYLGLAGGQPHFRLDLQCDGRIHHVEIAVPGHWSAAALLDRLPELRPQGISLSLEILEASPESTRVQVTTPMRVTYEGAWDTMGLGMADALALPDELRPLVNWMMRRGAVGLAEVTAYTGQDVEVTRRMLETLVEEGFIQTLEVEGEPHYRLQLALRRGRQMPEEIWQALDEQGEVSPRIGNVPPRIGVTATAQWARELFFGERGRLFLSLSPVMIVCLLDLWLLATGVTSFAGVLSFAGVIGQSLLSGIYPVLLLVSSRRKSDFVLGVLYRFLGHPFVMTGIYVLFLANFFLHGLVIWQDPFARATAVCSGLLVLGLTVVMVRRGAFDRRIVVQLGDDQRQGGGAVFAITAGGQPATAEVRLGYPEGERCSRAATGEVPMFSALRYAMFQLPANHAKELKVWAHRVTPDGGSEGLPAVLELREGEQTKRFDLKLSGGEMMLPLTGEACWLKIVLLEPSPS